MSLALSLTEQSNNDIAPQFVLPMPHLKENNGPLV